ncbi:unnamed protein product, partial [Phaeothamnion confervicola]
MDDVWKNAFLSTAAISVLPTMVLPFVPASAGKPGSGLQKCMLAFASGSMLGDVFLHLLPHLNEHYAAGDGGHHHHQHGDHDDHGDHDHHHHDHDHHDHSDHDHGAFHGVHHDAAMLSQPHAISRCPHHRALAAGKGAWADARTAVAEQQLGLLILAGFMFFFVCERLIHSFAG